MKVREIVARIEELRQNIDRISAIRDSYEKSGQDTQYTQALDDAIKCMQIEFDRYTNAEWEIQPY